MNINSEINEVLKNAGIEINESLENGWLSSPKGQTVKKQPIQNVGQLIEFLKKFPSDTKIAGGDKYLEFEYLCEVYDVKDYNDEYVGFISKTW